MQRISHMAGSTLSPSGTEDKGTMAQCLCALWSRTSFSIDLMNSSLSGACRACSRLSVSGLYEARTMMSGLMFLVDKLWSAVVVGNVREGIEKASRWAHFLAGPGSCRQRWRSHRRRNRRPNWNSLWLEWFGRYRWPAFAVLRRLVGRRYVCVTRNCG